MDGLKPFNITAVGTFNAIANYPADLITVNVNTGAAGAVLKLYKALTANAPDLFATIDCSSPASFGYGIHCPSGITAVLSGGNADITLGYE